MSAGIYGFVDFVGYPTGYSVPVGGGSKVGGRNLAYYYALVAMEEQRRRDMEQVDRGILAAIMQKVEERYGEYERQRREMLQDMQRTVLLAEI